MRLESHAQHPSMARPRMCLRSDIAALESQSQRSIDNESLAGPRASYRSLRRKTVTTDSERPFDISRNVSLPVHSQWFHVLITLFPECFSSVAQATCSLSVFAQYLALRGTHLAIHAPIPKYATHGLGRNSDQYGSVTVQGCHLLWQTIPGYFITERPDAAPACTTILTA